MDFEDDPTKAYEVNLTLDQLLAGAVASARRGEVWSLGGLQRAMSHIRWAEPLKVERPRLRAVCYYACRICIANYGLDGRDIERLPTDKNVVHAHVRAAHIDATSDDRLPAPEVSSAGKR